MGINRFTKPSWQNSQYIFFIKYSELENDKFLFCYYECDIFLPTAFKAQLTSSSVEEDVMFGFAATHAQFKRKSDIFGLPIRSFQVAVSRTLVKGNEDAG